jgi:hypothetical protein
VAAHDGEAQPAGTNITPYTFPAASVRRCTKQTRHAHHATSRIAWFACANDLPYGVQILEGEQPGFCLPNASHYSIRISQSRWASFGAAVGRARSGLRCKYQTARHKRSWKMWRRDLARACRPTCRIRVCLVKLAAADASFAAGQVYGAAGGNGTTLAIADPRLAALLKRAKPGILCRLCRPSDFSRQFIGYRQGGAEIWLRHPQHRCKLNRHKPGPVFAAIMGLTCWHGLALNLRGPTILPVTASI